MIPSIIFFGIPRGGSSICGEVLAQLATASGYTHVDIEGDYYKRGVTINDIPEDVFDKMEVEGHFYGPFRTLPNRMLEMPLSAFRKLLVVRDPRDCITSSYFANKYIHTVFRSGVAIDDMRIGREVGDIDDFAVRECFVYRLIFDRLVSLTMRNPDIALYQYEDIFHNSSQWVQHVVSTLALAVPDDIIYSAYRKINMIAYTEDPTRHHRQGWPRDHLRKLKPATSETIMHILREAVAWFCYRPRIVDFTGSRASNVDNVPTRIDSLIAAINELARENGYRIDEIDKLRKTLEKIILSHSDSSIPQQNV